MYRKYVHNVVLNIQNIKKLINKSNTVLVSDLCNIQKKKMVVDYNNYSEDTKVTFDELRILYNNAQYFRYRYCEQDVIGPGTFTVEGGMDESVNMNMMMRQKPPVILVTVSCMMPHGIQDYALQYREFEIEYFSGRRELGSPLFGVYPIRNISEEEKLVHQVRGIRFNEILSRINHMKAKGMFYIQTQFGMHGVEIDSRVMVDPVGFRKWFDSNKFKSTQSYKEIPEELIVATNPTVPAFSFEYRRWGEVPVNDLYEIQYDKTAFDRTIIPEEYRADIKACVLNYNSTETAQFIESSGRKEGLIIQLNGEPGVGKTLTAKSIAELTEKPLYSVSAGDLGTTPDQIDRKLKQILEMVAHWNGICLIDEADQYMSRRMPYKMVYNSCVSVFLNHVETYAGIMFLTTNRREDFDPAFESRITIKLEYSRLDANGRALIWKETLRRYKAPQITDEEINTVSSYNFNNREISQIARMACIRSNGGNNLTVNTLQRLCEQRMSVMSTNQQ